MLSWPPRRLARCRTYRAAASESWAAKAPSARVLDRAGEAVGAEQVRVAQGHRQRALDVHLHVGVGPEAAGDDVAGHRAGRLHRVHVVAADQLPDQAVVEGHLVDPPRPDPVDPRVADVGDQGPLGQQEEGRAGGAHPLEVFIGGGLAVDQGADLAVGLGHRLGGRAVAGLEVVVGDVVAGHLAGQLPHGVGPHAVGDHEQVAATLPGLGVGGPDDRMAVLVVRAPHPGVGRGSLDDGVTSQFTGRPCPGPRRAGPRSTPIGRAGRPRHSTGELYRRGASLLKQNPGPLAGEAESRGAATWIGRTAIRIVIVVS